MYSSLTTALLPLVLCQLDEDNSLHFSDLQRGRALWIVEDSTLPWEGSYEYLRSQSSSQTVLLKVVDSSSGNALGECTEISEEAPHWKLFQWVLKPDSILCSVLPSNSSRILFPMSTSPRTFSLRLEANHGPTCIRDLQVHNERAIGCPPHLAGNSFSSQFLNCSCPYEGENHEPVFKNPNFPLFELVGTESSSHIPEQSWWTTSSCAEIVCLNNGSCAVTQEGSAACLCQNGFIGSACEVDVCSSVQCLNGGQCQVNGGETYCDCPPFFTGIMCESAIVTCETPCINGQCIMENGTTRCACSHGFTGAMCNVVDICLTDTPCSMFGPQARCVASKSNFNATFECRCPHPVIGEFVDCLALHSPTSASESVSTTSVSRIVSTPEMMGVTSSSPNADITTSLHGITDSMLVTTVLVQLRKTGINSHSPATPTESTVISFFSPTTSHFSTSSESVNGTSFVAIVAMNNTDGDHTSASEISPKMVTEPHIETTSSIATANLTNSLTSSFTMHRSTSSGMTSSSPGHRPQSTIPFWMTATAHTSEGLNEDDDEKERVGHQTTSDFNEHNSGERRANKVSNTALGEGSGQRSSAASWIVAVVAVIVLGLLLLATSVFVLRYVKQSRKLHGKYNPAREEHALSAAYSMPMSHISKEERLI